VHAGRVAWAAVVEAAQVQTAVHDIQQQLASPIGIMGPGSTAGNGRTYDDLAVHVARARAFAEIEAEHVGGDFMAQPELMQAAHFLLTNDSDFQRSAAEAL
jgi:hypothetical protein